MVVLVVLVVLDDGVSAVTVVVDVAVVVLLLVCPTAPLPLPVINPKRLYPVSFSLLITLRFDSTLDDAELSLLGFCGSIVELCANNDPSRVVPRVSDQACCGLDDVDDLEWSGVIEVDGST